MSADNLREALVEEIRDLYNAEKQLLKALPKMAKGASNDELRDAFESHLEETEGQVTRLERVFELLDEKPRGKHCAGMAGIIEEGSEMLQEDMEDSVMDACLIASAPASRALRDGRLRHRRSRGPRRSSSLRWRRCFRRRSTKRRPRTRSCRRSPNPASTKRPRPASRKTTRTRKTTKPASRSASVAAPRHGAAAGRRRRKARGSAADGDREVRSKK